MMAGPAFAGDRLAANGCYERAYDAAHLKAHKGQFVLRARVEIVAPFDEQLTAKSTTIVANADFRVWVRGHKKRFESYGACAAQAGALACGGSVSAAEDDYCDHNRPGVHDCRVDDADAGDFKIEARPEGVLVTIIRRLELLYEASDSGPYLNLVEDDAENHAFLLKRTGDVCRPGNAPQTVKK
jgi:hypothetical protein